MIERWFGSYPMDRFLAEHYLKSPFVLAGVCGELASLADWSMVGQLASQPERDVLVVRSGTQHAGHEPRTEQESRALVAEGHTLVFRGAERHASALAPLAEAFRHDLAGAVDVHLYCTPANQFGFGWHYDAEEVFVFQTSGAKEYLLRKNTVHPWPVLESLPADMHYEREIMPLWKCRLAAGDLLYIPSGYWHMAKAEEEAISLALGVLSPTGVDIFDFLRPRIVESLRWRERLPVMGALSSLSEEPLDEAMQRRIAALAEDLAKMLTNQEFARQFMDAHRSRMGL